MPVKPVTNTLRHKIKKPSDVQHLFNKGVRIAKMVSRSRRQNAMRDLNDYFYYLGAVHPEYLPPFHAQLFELSDSDLAAFSFSFETWLYVLQNAQDQYVDLLFEKLIQNPEHWEHLTMLAAICTPHALAALGTFARTSAFGERVEQLGFHVPTTEDPAIPRFSVWRNAIKISPFQGTQAELAGVDNPVGLSLALATDEESQHLIRWHYLSFKAALLPDMPTIGLSQLHLVGPQLDSGWTLFCELQSDGRYRATSVVNEYPEDEQLAKRLEGYVNDDGDDLATAELVPFNDDLVYCNGHVLLTENIVGTVGGPPMGLYEIPKCLGCGMLMFHIATVVSDVRRYSEGFLNLFICETCKQIACQGTPWN